VAVKLSAWKWPDFITSQRLNTNRIIAQRSERTGLIKRRRRGIFVEPEEKKIFKLRQERHIPRMANTYTQIYIHVVFAVEGRQNLIKPEHNDELQKTLPASFPVRSKS
jgi:hypothetical protein